VVEYPERMAFYLQQDLPQTQIQSLRVSDAPAFVVSHITCSKDPKGQQLISEIDKVLPQLWQQPEHKEALFRWVDATTTTGLEQVYAELQQQMTVATLQE